MNVLNFLPMFNSSSALIRGDVIWWSIMVSIAVVGFIIMIVLFIKTFKWSKERRELKVYFLLIRIFGAIFASVALYRSIFVSSYPNRLSWFNTILNSPFIIRTVALFAELSFIGIIALILWRMNKDFPLDVKHKSLAAFFKSIPFVAFACVFVANILAYAGLVTQYLTLFAIEETLWGIAFLLILPLVLARLIRLKKTSNYHFSYKVFIIWMVAWCIGYSIFQWGFALPFMHWADVANDASVVIPPDALLLSITGFRVTRDYYEWGGIGFFVWHSAYFSICTWMVLSFMLGPRIEGTFLQMDESK